MNFEQHWQRYQQAAITALEERLPPVTEPPCRLHEAMRYATLNGGKRFRAVLVMMTGQLFDTELERLMAPAAAMECIHAYSLVHDDLPCMDDDDYRRGMPSCHKQYDEATAVLVGDALQALAFHILSADKSLINLSGKQGLLVSVLAQAAGSTGMVGGQMLDIEFEQAAGEIDPYTVHQLKTARLIQASVRLGALVSDDVNPEEYQALGDYGEYLGLAFQFRDDQLDGDALADNPIEKAKQMRDQALVRLRMIDRDIDNLEKLADFVITREI